MVAINADKCDLCAHTMRIFTAAYGAEAGVAALKWIPTGGTPHCVLQVSL
jgi:glucokinase